MARAGCSVLFLASLLLVVGAVDAAKPDDRPGDGERGRGPPAEQSPRGPPDERGRPDRDPSPAPPSDPTPPPDTPDEPPPPPATHEPAPDPVVEPPAPPTRPPTPEPWPAPPVESTAPSPGPDPAPDVVVEPAEDAASATPAARPPRAVEYGAPIRFTASAVAAPTTPAGGDPSTWPLGLGALVAAGGLVALGRRTRNTVAPARPAPPPGEGPPPAALRADAPLPAGVPGLLRLGQRAAERGAFDEALGWFDTVLALDAKLGAAHVCRAICLYELGRLEEAADAAALAIKTTQGDVIALQVRARALSGLGDHRGAMDAIAAIVAAVPGYAEAASLDPAFAPLRDHPRFLQILGKL